MNRKINLFLVIILCLAALLVLNQEKQKEQAAGKSSSTTSTVPPDRLVVTQAYPVKTLDPVDADDTGSLRVITNVYEGLVRFKPGTALVEPCLAKSWEISGDGTVWTFNLRSDVRFHDGTPFDARAVEYSVKRQTARQTEATTYSDFVYAPVQKVEVVDRYTVKFILKYPYAPFLNNLAMPMAAPVVGPEPAGTGGQPVPPPGTGPFIPAGEVDGGILLRANRDYRQALRGVEEILFIHVANSRRQAEMLLNRETDIALDLTFDDAARLRFQGLPVCRTSGLDISYLGFYTDREPFKRPAVRKAVALSLNREEIYKQLGLQQVLPAVGHLPPGVTGHVAADWTSSAAEAAQLLRELGYEKGLTFTLITFLDPRPYTPGGGKELAEALARSAARAGITIKVRAYPWEQFKLALQRREGDAFLYGWISDNGDPDNFLYTLLAPDQIEKGQNLTRYRSSRLETLLVSGRGTTDEEVRRELYARAQDVIDRDTPWVVLGHSLHHAATAPGVSGFALSPTGWHALGGVKKD